MFADALQSLVDIYGKYIALGMLAKLAGLLLILSMFSSAANLGFLLNGVQGYLAQDYSIQEEDGSPSPACTALQQKMDAMMGLRSSREGGVWMECCIKTYFTDRNRHLDTCQFRLFGAQLRQV